uniref:Uncharacterized protein n=1 Tax=Cannabis sativa TaxID=3483 RepID=A0A803QHF9_CANSA
MQNSWSYKRQNPHQNSGRGNQNHTIRGGGYRGRGRGGSGNGSKPTCKYGHSVVVCYNKYDESYMGHKPNTETTQHKQCSAIIATPEMLNDDIW